MKLKFVYVMFIAAVVIYIVFGILFGPLWPLELIAGNGGCLGQIIAIAWGSLLIAGFAT